MNKSRTVKLAAFNIVTHPHSSESYEGLFNAAKDLKQMIKIRGDTYGLLCSAFKLDESNTGTITGEIFTFLNIDPKQPWFDILKGEEATEKDTKEVKIPEHLRPNLKRFRYVFFPASHFLIYSRDDSVNGAISPSSMKEFLTALLNDNRIIGNAPYQVVDVRLIQDRKSLDWIFENIAVEQLDIVIRRPNGDTGGEAEESIEKEMSDQNIDEYFISQKSEKGKAIKPNKRTERLMGEATINGHITAKGQDKDGITKTADTAEHPLIESFVYDPKTSYIDFVVNAGRKIVEKIQSIVESAKAETTEAPPSKEGSQQSEEQS